MTQKQPIAVLFYIYVKPRAQKVKQFLLLLLHHFLPQKFFILHPFIFHLTAMNLTETYQFMKSRGKSTSNPVLKSTKRATNKI